MVSTKKNGKPSREVSPYRGEVGVFNGMLAVCVREGGLEASDWIIRGVHYRIKLKDISRVFFGYCKKIHQNEGAVTLRLGNIHHEVESDPEEVLVPLKEITRFYPEYEGWEDGRWLEQPTLSREATLKRASLIGRKVLSTPHADSWEKLLGEPARNQLAGLLEATNNVASMIEKSQGACTDLPSPDLKSYLSIIMNNLKRPPEPFKRFDELSRSEQSAYGAVIGALVGDAAGGVLEFLGRIPTPPECERALVMPGGGVFDLAPGQFTDDGEMTVTLLRELAKNSGLYTQPSVAAAYNEWAMSHPFDIGNATANALRVGSHAATNEPVHVVIEKQALDRNSSSKANGSLMRATPLGIAAVRLSVEEAAEVARSDARLTHPNPVCQVSTAAYVLSIRHLILHPGDNKGAFLIAEQYAQANNEEVAEWMLEAREGSIGPVQPMAGFVKHGFTLAFFYMYRGTSYKKAVLETLAKGGDTDTNACIVGGLIGALHGVEKLPPESVSNMMSCNTDNGQPRAEKYTVKPVVRNLRELCRVLVA